MSLKRKILLIIKEDFSEDLKIIASNYLDLEEHFREKGYCNARVDVQDMKILLQKNDWDLSEYHNLEWVEYV